MFRFTFPTVQIDCILFTIKSYVNISDSLASQGEHSLDSSATRAAFLPLANYNINFLFFSTEDNSKRFVLLNSGLSIEKYTFGTEVTPMRNTNTSGYLEPFDSTTWTLLITSILLLSIVSARLRAVDTINTRFTPSDLLFLLLSQCNIQLFSRHVTFKILYILPIWYFASMLFSEMYKGELLSMMTVSTIPNVPKSLEEIPEHNNAYLATTKTLGYYKSGKPVEFRSTIQNSIQGILENRGLSRRRKKLLMKISNRLQYHGGKTATTGFTDLLKKIIEHRNFTNLIYLDGTKAVNILKMVLEVFTEKKLMKGESIDEFMLTFGMVFQRNFLYKLINPYFTMLWESGIPHQWEKVMAKRMQFNVLKQMWNTLNVTLKNFRKESIFSFIISDRKRRLHLEPRPISITDFKIFGYTYLVLIGVCNIALSLEIIRLVCLKVAVSWTNNDENPAQPSPKNYRKGKTRTKTKKLNPVRHKNLGRKNLSDPAYEIKSQAHPITQTRKKKLSVTRKNQNPEKKLHPMQKKTRPTQPEKTVTKEKV